MKIESNISLLPYNTFGVDARCAKFYSYSSVADLNILYKECIFSSEWMTIGGGSNLLFLEDFEGAILRSLIEGIEVVEDCEREVLVRVGSGVVWDDFVAWSVENNYGGVENLSYIPGSVGASPVQNIGAYGVEAKDVIYEVEFFDVKTGRFAKISNKECKFAYRNSLFKENSDYIVTHVIFRLTKSSHYSYILSYGNLQSALEKKEVTPSLKAIRDIVIDIRKSKLPEPAEIGSAGSFFKNSIVSESQFLKIQESYPNMPFYEMEGGGIKIPSGWLIEQCGWKGKRFGNVGVYDKQALVLVNYGGASGREIEALSNQIRHSVLSNFEILIEPEVCFIGTPSKFII
jgi:UDP-N-acetylmuramate dehydrogenase